MDRAKVEKWMNKMVKVTKQFVNVKDIEGVSRCSQLKHGHGYDDVPYVQLYSGLHEIAKTLDLKVSVDFEDDDSICYIFNYDGVDFIQLDDKER